MASSICWGIEVGAGAVKAIKLSIESGGGVEVLDYAIVPHKRVLSTPDLDQDDATRVALGTLVSQHDLSGAVIGVSVPGHSSFARFAKLPPVEKKKIPEIVKFEAVQQIPFPIEEVEWDYQTFASPDSPDVEVGIFAITRERIVQQLSMLRDVGITPDYVNLSPVAAYNALAYDLQFTEKTPGTVILDVGTTSTDLIVAEAGRVWVRTFPIGGHAFTEALVEQFKLSYIKAEKLKREAESSKHARHVFQAMRPVFMDLAQEIQRSLGYYASLHKDANLVRLIGLGSTFELPGLRRYLKQQLQMDVYRLDEFKRVNLAEDQKQAINKSALQMTTAYGMAVQGLGMDTIKANLMPSAIIRDSMWRKKKWWFGMAAALGVASGLAWQIRPMLDSSAVASEPQDPVVRRAMDALSKAQGNARDAGVVGSSQTDYSAANMVVLLEDREIYGQIVDDLGQMFVQADQLSQDKKPAFELVSFNTKYIGPDGDSAAAIESLLYGGRNGMAGEIPDDPFEGRRRIKIELVVKTTQPDPQQFLLSTMNQWLIENAQREGIPYEIFTDEQPWEMVSSEKIESEDDGTAVADPTRPNDRRNRGRRGEPGRGGGRMPDLGEVEEVGAGGNDGFSGPTRRGNKRSGRNNRSGGDIRKIAPLPDRPAAYEPGTTITTFKVTWNAILDLEVKEGEDQ